MGRIDQATGPDGAVGEHLFPGRPGGRYDSNRRWPRPAFTGRQTHRAVRGRGTGRDDQREASPLSGAGPAECRLHPGNVGPGLNLPVSMNLTWIKITSKITRARFYTRSSDRKDASHFLAWVEVVSLAPGFRVVSAEVWENGFNRFLERRIAKQLKRLTRGARPDTGLNHRATEK